VVVRVVVRVVAAGLVLNPRLVMYAWPFVFHHRALG
jgi:hypothetical protein